MKKLVLCLASVSLLMECKPMTDYGYVDTYVFTNQTDHNLTLATYTILSSDEVTKVLKPGQDTSFVYAEVDTGKRPNGPTPTYPLPMASDSVIIRFDDDRQIVFRRDSVRFGSTPRSVYTMKSYTGRTNGGRSNWQYIFDPQHYQQAK